MGSNVLIHSKVALSLGRDTIKTFRQLCIIPNYYEISKMSGEQSHFILHANCMPVNGAMRSIVCDLQLGRYRFLPTDTAKLITRFRSHSIIEVLSIYPKYYQESILGQLRLLCEGDWGFFTNEPERFPPISLDWYSPSLVTNFIMDLDSNSEVSMSRVAALLDEVGCEAVQIRAYDKIQPCILHSFIDATKYSCIKNIELVLKYSSELELQFLSNLAKENTRVSRIFVHSCPTNQTQTTTTGRPNVYFSNEHLTSHNDCGRINLNFFNCNITLFTESQKFNSCLNRKLSIDARGDIRICPSMKRSFGNISEVTLSSVARLEEVRTIWGIHKDQVSVCRDCEFRYICIDCRAHVSDENDPYSKPAKCKYDPYKATWKD